MAMSAVLLSVVLLQNVVRPVLGGDGERCTSVEERSVNECLQPVLDYAAKLESDTTTLQFPLQGNDVFKKLCSIFMNFKKCVAPISCDSLSVDAIEASYGYMCGSGQPLFEQYAGCFAGVELEESYISCKTAATQAIAEAQETKLQSSSTEAYLAEMCRAMDGYLRCSHPVILEKCGAEAWKLVSTVTRDSLGVTMPDCDMRSALI